MASTSATLKMLHEEDEFMSPINTPIKLLPIESKEAFNFDIEATWQLFIPKIQVNKKLWYLFHHTFNYWGFFVVNGANVIIFCISQMLQCVVHHLFVVQVDVKNLSKGKNKRLLSYNKDQGTNLLKNHTSNEHPKVYKRWGLFLL